MHGHVNFRLTESQIQAGDCRAEREQSAASLHRGQGVRAKLVGRLVSRRKAHKVGSFPELPGSLMLRRARRLTD